MSLKQLIEAKKLALLTCRPDDFLDEAIDTMVTAGKNAIAVVEKENQLVGILTDHDIIRAVHEQQVHGNTVYQEHVFSRMSENVITCPANTKVSASLKLMGKHNIRHLVVTDNNIPIAVVSIRDILMQIHEQDELEANVLRDIAMASRASVAA